MKQQKKAKSSLDGCLPYRIDHEPDEISCLLCNGEGCSNCRGEGVISVQRGILIPLIGREAEENVRAKTTCS